MLSFGQSGQFAIKNASQSAQPAGVMAKSVQAAALKPFRPKHPLDDALKAVRQFHWIEFQVGQFHIVFVVCAGRPGCDRAGAGIVSPV